jgi:uncharacterized protein (DUF58 family)
MIPAELIRRIRRLEISTRRVVSSVLSGQYHSVFKGRGMAFSEVRQYQPGDEVRTIDWNVTARMREPYVKVFTEERELTVVLLVDVSGSQAFGSRERSKAEIAAEVAAQIAFSAIANNDRVGLILFSDRIEKVVPPRKGRSHVLRLVADILTCAPKGRGTDLAAALTYLTHVVKRQSVVFLVSDFLVAGFEQPLRLAAKRHDLVPVVIADPAEDELPDAGLVLLEDPETLASAVVDTSDRRVRERFAAAMRRHRQERERAFRRLRLDSVELKAHEEYAASLQAFFRTRARRARAS